ncbi:MAG: hypothetical protein ACUVXA_18150 [Candidatus Jordarchaeum sp.]|uniref:hypothetical protein n=1 Tax=Candidatus Jordarchaeum sp. TaxID=2823881 RepID=UPI00404B248E
MFRKVLRRKRYWRSRNHDEIVYINHEAQCGGIYVTIKPREAVVRIAEWDMIKVFTSAKKLEEFLEELQTPELS